MGWATLPQWRADYADAPRDDATAQRYLDAAQEQCEAYAPALLDGEELPERYTLAHLLQARELRDAQRRDTTDAIGGDGFVFRVRPLSGAVKALLRPPSPRSRRVG